MQERATVLIRNMAIDNKSMEQLAEWSGGKVLAELVELAISRTPCEPSSSRHATFAISNIAAAGKRCCGGKSGLMLSAAVSSMPCKPDNTFHRHLSKCRSHLGLGDPHLQADSRQRATHCSAAPPICQPAGSMAHGRCTLLSATQHGWRQTAVSPTQSVHAIPCQLVS